MEKLTKIIELLNGVFTRLREFGNDVGWLSNILGLSLIIYGVLWVFSSARSSLKKRRIKILLKEIESKNISSDLFKIGVISDSFVLIEGNGIETFSRIITKAIPIDVSLPSEVLEESKIVTQEMLNQNSNSFKLFNGDIYSFFDYRTSRTDRDEGLYIELDFKHSKYFEFLAFDRLIRKPEFYKTYMSETLDTKKPKCCLAFGICLTIITSDNKLIIPRRSDKVSIWKNCFTVSANEALSRQLDKDESGRPDLYYAGQRAAKEELGIDLPVELIRFYGLGFETKSLQWGLLGTARVNLSSLQIGDHFRIGAKDRFEHSELCFIDFTPKRVIQFLKDHDLEMIPSAKAQFILSLLNHGNDFNVIRDLAYGRL